MNVLWSHEEDGGQCASIHLGYRDGEDEQPGENTGHGVDHSQDGITQKKPNISADATLQRRKKECCKIIESIKVNTSNVLKITSTLSPNDLSVL